MFNIAVNGAEAVARPVGAPDGNGKRHLIKMPFDQPVSSLAIRLTNGTGDGFVLDGARVSAVPVPAAALLFRSAIGGLAMVLRWRTAR